MGCFNVAGGMSNLTIGCKDKVAFFLLSKNKRSYFNNVIGETNLISNEGACIFLEPYCPPIFGEYDDYGRIENIVRTQTVENLESYFGADIESILSVVFDQESLNSNFEDSETVDDLTDELQSLSGMFEHEEVYKQMVNYNSKQMTVYENGYFTKTVMEMMGFEYAGQEVNPSIKYGPERYNNKYIKGDLEVYTDGTWLGDSYRNKGVDFSCQGCYHPKHVAKVFDVSPYGEISNKDVYEVAIEDYNAEESFVKSVFGKTYPIKMVKVDIGSIGEQVDLQHFTDAMYSTNHFY